MLDTIHTMHARLTRAVLLGAVFPLVAAQAAAVPTDLVIDLQGDLEEGGPPATLWAIIDKAAPAGGQTVTLTVVEGAECEAAVRRRCATQGVDYSLASSILIAEGKTNGTTTVTVIDDSVAALTSNSLEKNVFDNDDPPAPENLTVTPGDGELRVSWDPADTDSHAARGYHVFHKKATAPGDETGDPDTGWVYTGVGGSKSTTLTITGLTNGVEYDVRVRAVFYFNDRSAFVGASGTPSAGDGAVPTVWLSATPSRVNEGSSVTVTATLSAALDSGVTIPLTVTRNTSEPGDHVALLGIAISSGASSGTGTITTAHDDDTDNETFTVALGMLPPSVTEGAPASAKVTILDDDWAGGGEDGDDGSGSDGDDGNGQGSGGDGGDDGDGQGDGGDEGDGDGGDESGTGTTSPRPVVNSMSVVDTSLRFKRASDDRLYFGIHDGRRDTVNDAVPEPWNIWQVPLEFDAVKLYEDGQLYIDIDRSDGERGAVQSALDPEIRYAVTLEYTNKHGAQVVYTAVFDEDIGDIHLYPDNGDDAVRFYDALAGRSSNTSYSEVTLTATVSDDPDIQPTAD